MLDNAIQTNLTCISTSFRNDVNTALMLELFFSCEEGRLDHLLVREIHPQRDMNGKFH